MKQKPNTKPSSFSCAEMRLVEQLRQHPEIMVRVQSILEIAHHGEGPLKKADEVEDLLVEEMRRLGNVTMVRWATLAEERVSQELRSQDPTVRSRKKKGSSGGASLE